MMGLQSKGSGPIWGLAGFILGAALSGTAVAALGHSALSPDKPQATATGAPANAAFTLPQRIIVSVVKPEEMEAAMGDFPAGAQPKIRKDLSTGKYRLLWLTAWDWDTTGATGDTISILSGDYRRFVILNSHRTRIAIPEPQSGYIEMRGEVTEDGVIAISVLSGTQPIALPRMSAGQTIRVKIDS